MKRKNKFFSTAAMLCCVCALLFMQTADAAVADSGAYCQFEASPVLTVAAADTSQQLETVPPIPEKELDMEGQSKEGTDRDLEVKDTEESAPVFSGKYRSFEAAPGCNEADLAAMAMGKVIAANQKSKLEQEAMKPKIDPTKPMIALTFDDGPNGQVTERILTVLEKYNGRGTFFMVGNRIGSSSAPILQRMAANGHELGNHSYSHKNFSKSGSAVIRAEIMNNQNAIAAALGPNYSAAVPKLTRVPYGASGKTVGNAVGMPMIQWSVDTLDWKTRNAGKTVQSILNNAKDGDIILMHDLHEPTATACEKVIPILAERGFQFVTVSELFEAKGMELKPGVMYYKAR